MSINHEYIDKRKPEIKNETTTKVFLDDFLAKYIKICKNGKLKIYQTGIFLHLQKIFPETCHRQDEEN